MGKFKSLEHGGVSTFDPNSGGSLARVPYVGHFEKGDGNITVIASVAGGQWRIVSFNVNSPLLLDNPADYRQNVEIYVADSDMVMPGAHVKVVARSPSDKVLVEDAVVLDARWKVTTEQSHEGFVTLSLSADGESAVKKTEGLSVKAIK